MLIAMIEYDRKERSDRAPGHSHIASRTTSTQEKAHEVPLHGNDDRNGALVARFRHRRFRQPGKANDGSRRHRIFLPPLPGATGQGPRRAARVLQCRSPKGALLVAEPDLSLLPALRAVQAG